MAKKAVKKAEVKKEEKVIAPELVKKPYTLERDTPIGKKEFKKGDTVLLTDKGRDYFKSINLIKIK